MRLFSRAVVGVPACPLLKLELPVTSLPLVLPAAASSGLRWGGGGARKDAGLPAVPDLLLTNQHDLDHVT